MNRRSRRVGLVGALVAVGTLAGCPSPGGDSTVGPTSATGTPNPGNCVVVETAVSPEKLTLLTELAKDFAASPASTVDGRCTQVNVRRKSSGAGAAALVAGWDEATDGPRPVIWSPASSAWAAIVNQRLAEAGKPPIAPRGEPFMVTPLVIAMPKPMADALGYPATPIGFEDIVRLATTNEGWAAFGHPEWGQFRLGKTNPNFSTSGLSFTIAQYYAATGKDSGLTAEDLAEPAAVETAKQVESAVVHYGDTTLTFLNNWFRADARGTALTYVSAVAVEEKSLVDYNTGNPDGILDPGERPRPPRVPLVAIYPKEGTLYSDNPLIVLDAEWVSPEQRAAAAAFSAFVRTPENQAKVLEFGFRPGIPDVAIGAPLTAANGVDPAKPDKVLQVPEPAVMSRILDAWASQRKTARVMLVIDVSGSMGDPAGGESAETKLDLAKRAAVEALGQFKDDDEVGLRIFTTDLSRSEPTSYADLVPVGPIGPVRESLANRIRGLQPLNGTPLYDVTASSYAAMLDGYDPARINAVVLLTDGRNEDGNRNDDADQLQGLLDELEQGSEGATSRPVRIFTIAYGSDADFATLRRIAEATTGAAYDASNPATINQVFTNVISNF